MVYRFEILSSPLACFGGSKRLALLTLDNGEFKVNEATDLILGLLRQLLLDGDFDERFPGEYSYKRIRAKYGTLEALVAAQEFIHWGFLYQVKITTLGEPC